jgi:hypothetical protein
MNPWSLSSKTQVGCIVEEYYRGSSK